MPVSYNTTLLKSPPVARVVDANSSPLELTADPVIAPPMSLASAILKSPNGTKLPVTPIPILY